MEAFFGHILKSAGILLLFLVFYHLFLRRETYFTSNRWFLFVGLLTSALLPFVTLTSTIVRERPQPTFGFDYSVVQALENGNNGLQWSDFVLLAFTIYVLGCCYFGIRLLKELYAIKKIKRQAEIIEEDEYFHVHTKYRISPFSFFKHIFYHPKQFLQRELAAIIVHEKVHAKQWHTLDILLTELVIIFQWFNPAVWFYKSMVKQNLEFLADSKTCEINGDKKFYQYLVLKQAVKHNNLAIASPFFNSLTHLTFMGRSISWIRPFGQVKKRIVMLNQNQSKKMSRLKLVLIIPFLALFLMAFNTEKVYVADQDQLDKSISTFDNSVELTIDKNTSDVELERIKTDLAKKGIDFSYTVVHNAKKEIIDISIQMSGKSSDGENFSGSYSSDSGTPIKPLTIFYDDKSNSIFFGNAKHHTIKVHEDGDQAMMWKGLDEVGKHEDIHIVRKEGHKKMVINGKEVDKDELHDHDVKINGHERKNHENVFIIKDSNDENDIEIIDEKVNLFFFDTDGKSDMRYFIDGKKASPKAVKKINPEAIESIEVLKGDGAIKKYGKKAKNGVVEITMKKE